MIRHKDILTEDKVPEKLGEEEVKTCVGFLVPVAISQLAASEADTAEASLSLIQNCLAWKDPNRFEFPRQSYPDKLRDFVGKSSD